MSPITDQPSPGGWNQFYGVRIAKALALGTIALAAVFNIHGAINSQSVPGTSTGSILQVDGLTRRQEFPTACSATGGLTSYSVCAARSPLSTTGSLLAFGIECGNWKVAMYSDVSFKKTRTAASGTVLAGGNNLLVGTGANLQSALAVPVSWNPADLLTVTSLTAPTGTLNTTRYDCKLWTTISDKYGS